MRILVVEHDPAILELLCHVCERGGYETLRATCATEALVLLRSTEVDVLAADVGIKGLDGLALMRRARTLQPDIRTILLTGTSGRYSLDEMLDAGASDVLLKPLRAPELLARLKLVDLNRRQVEGLQAKGRALEAASAETITGLQREIEELRLQVGRLLATDALGEQLV